MRTATGTHAEVCGRHVRDTRASEMPSGGLGKRPVLRSREAAGPPASPASLTASGSPAAAPSSTVGKGRSAWQRGLFREAALVAFQ